MNYEQLWKGLKAEYEICLTKYKELYKAACESKDKDRIDFYRENYFWYRYRLDRIYALEKNQQKTDREEIESAIDELKRDRQFERYRIKHLVFIGGDENDRLDCRKNYLEAYSDYELYRWESGWFIVFHNGEYGEEYFPFDYVKIVYWDEKETK